jgi:Xanthine and CO dehydrogenases maturation factor, XdhC/CoxF family
MREEIKLWQFAAERLKRGESVILLVVAESEGSSPGREGFKMIVARDELAGSIGGGVMEVALVEQAREVLRRSEAQTKNKKKAEENFSKLSEQVHRKNSLNSSGMICSGRQTVVFFKLSPAHLKTVRKIISSLRKNRSEILQISASEIRLANLSENFNFRFSSENGEFLYEEKLGYKNRLFIVGGGHCALALSELMSKLDFYISLFDDRKDLNTLIKNRFAHEKRIIESYEKIGEFIPSGEDVYVVVMTLGYRFDEIVIKKLLGKDFRYFGVLGSRAKMATLLRGLKEQGFDAERLKRIRTPIGLPINSRTPAEIAVSIAAEIIAVKNDAQALI